MPPSKKGKRKVRCNGKLKIGPWKGERCSRTKMLPVDRHENTLTWKCASHRD